MIEDKNGMQRRVSNQSTDEILSFNKGKKEYIHIKTSNSVCACVCICVFSTQKTLVLAEQKNYTFRHICKSKF